jgi:hypothetical protein
MTLWRTTTWGSAVTTSPPDAPATRTHLESVLADLAQAGFPGAEDVVAAMAAAVDAPPEQRAEALRVAWLRTAEASMAILSRGVDRTDAVLHGMTGDHRGRGPVQRLNSALREQRRGMGLLAEYLGGGPRERVEEARRAVTVGVQEAQQAARDAEALRAPSKGP